MTAPTQAQIDAALDRLASKFLTHPQVSLIDYGLGDTGLGDTGLDLEKSKSVTPSLRIHLRTKAGETEFPKEVDGIPVRLVHANYRLE
jgi:hypothetical protein